MAHTPNRRNDSRSKNGHFRTGHILSAVIGLGVITTGSVAAYVSSMEKYESPKAVIEEQLPDHVVIASLLMEAGISPESLAVAGFSGSEASAVIQGATDEADRRFTAYRAALENWHAAGRSLTQLRRQGGASAQELANAREQVQMTRQTMDGLVGLVSSASLVSFDADETRRLSAYETNAGRDLPLAFKAKAWSPSEYLDLSLALQQKTANESRGEEVDQRAAALIAQAFSDGDVAVAANSLDSRLAAIQAAWDSAIRGGE